MKRNDLIEYCLIDEDNNEVGYCDPEEVENFIDSIENKVNDAFTLLDSIKSIDDLDQIKDCCDVLRELKKDLY